MTTTVKALVAGAAIVITVAGASGAAFAAKKADNTRPGWGYGDKNHVHTGPPGQSVHP